MVSDEPMKQHAPSAERNREPLLAVLRELLPSHGTVLEVASGTGQHAVFFARAFPGLVWQPTDADAVARSSIEAWRREEGLPNVREPLALDARAPTWPVESADAIVCINMIHISPWEACQGLMRGAARVLPSGGPLLLYGAYVIEGRPTAPSNLAFDASLRERNPAWGVRELGAVTAEARAHGLELDRVIDMPSNNFTVVFRQRGG
jgi:cyclopropane fatty-acyl-phospholipid synthase-like methyltransferase